MSSPLEIAAILRFVDRFTAPAKAAMNDTLRMAEQSEQWSKRHLENINEQKKALGGSALETMGQAYAMQRLVQPAIDYEKAMAEVGKVVEFNADNGLTKLGEDILRLNSEGGIPMAAEGIADIIAAAGQSGIVDAALPDDEKRRQLLAFAETAAQMGVAFDVSGDQAGQAMAQWRASLGLSQNEAIQMGDAINHLANNMNAAAPALLDVVSYQGAVAKASGLASDEIAALGAAFLSGGASPERASTGMKNFLSTLTAGEAITKRKNAALTALGFSSTELAKRMQTDATGAIEDVLNALAQVDDYKQSAMVSDLFGEESKGAIMPLLTNLDNLKNAFALVEDDGGYAGSMLREFQGQAGTTAAQIQITSNYMKGFAIAIGSAVLPEINALLQEFAPLISAATEWARANPEMISFALKSAAALIALRMSTIGIGYGFLTIAGPALRFINLMSAVPRYMGLAVSGARLFSGALRMVAAAAMANPLLLILGAVAFAIYKIYQNWDGVVVYFSNKVDAVKGAFEGGLLNGILKIIAEFNPFTLMIEGINALIKDITGFDLLGTVKGWMNFKWKDLLPKWNWSDIIPKVNLGGWFGGGSDDDEKPPISPPPSGPGPAFRDGGGPVAAGFPYIVGERGPELFIPNGAGKIATTRELKAMREGIDRRAPLQAIGSGFASPAMPASNTFVVTIQQSPGMSAADVRRELEEWFEEMSSRSSALYDEGMD